MKQSTVISIFLVCIAIAVGVLLFAPRTIPQDQTPLQSEPAETTLPPAPLSRATKDDMIVVDAPLVKEKILSPVTIAGKARGNWFFEGSFPVSLVDWDGKILASGIAQADGEWMTTEYVPFTATLSYTVPDDIAYRRAYLILKKDNPSDDPKFDNALEYEVTI